MAMLCSETDIESFVHNVNDIKELSLTMTPTIIQYFKSVMNVNKFTK